MRRQYWGAGFTPTLSQFFGLCAVQRSQPDAQRPNRREIKRLSVHFVQTAFAYRLFFFRFNQSVVAVVAFVYDIDLAAFSVAEYKEGVVEHIHLQDGFFNLHWLYREAFGFDDLVFVRLSYISSTKSGVKAAAFIRFSSLDLFLTI